MPMPNLFDTLQVRDEAEHWDALAERVTAYARMRSRVGVGDFIGSRAGWIAAAVMVTAALGLIALRGRTSGGDASREDFARQLAPADQIGQAIALNGSPPAIGALLLVEAGARR